MELTMMLSPAVSGAQVSVSPSALWSRLLHDPVRARGISVGENLTSFEKVRPF
jgi:hypothetical protein